MSMIMHRAEARPGQTSATYKHFFVERPCRILVVGQHLKPKTKYNGLLRHISIGGAMIDFNPAVSLPQHFFVEIVGFPEEIGSTVVHRVGSELGVRFNMQLSQDVIRQLIRMDFAQNSIANR
ncbi:PilZ domain-containing protein [Rhizobium sp. 9140]|uniref:PilZ domain-containing protein n=1 Tax=Rhizobium sp. 9140 TaxID=1761900 RepID=UPI00079916EE|nr:PilZ domain-containing protein [Rhizobium sp. 9140]CZT34605.1 PilZ domain-containing protein [Rhizobium sp. 9140]